MNVWSSEMSASSRLRPLERQGRDRLGVSKKVSSSPPRRSRATESWSRATAASSRSPKATTSISAVEIRPRTLEQPDEPEQRIG